jgi:hypothetical protein
MEDTASMFTAWPCLGPCLQHVYSMFTPWPCLGPARIDGERGATQGEQRKGRSATAQLRMADAQKHARTHKRDFGWV